MHETETTKLDRSSTQRGFIRNTSSLFVLSFL